MTNEKSIDAEFDAMNIDDQQVIKKQSKLRIEDSNNVHYLEWFSQSKPKLTLDILDGYAENDKTYMQYKKLKELEGINCLKFPGHAESIMFNAMDFVSIAPISCNANAIVEKYCHKPTNKIIAVKFLRIPFSNDVNKFESSFNKIQRELDAYKKLSSSPNLVKFYGFCIYGGYISIFMEYMDMSLDCLYKQIHQQYGRFPHDLLGDIAVSVVDALKDLKSKSIMHRDIKPQNILINKEGQIKLCDFGVSRILVDSHATTVNTDTVLYWPPERFDMNEEDAKYDIRADVWSLGITLAEIAKGEYPIEIDRGNKSFSYEQIFNAIKNLTIEDAIPQELPNNFKEFITNCLQPLDARPSYTQLINSSLYIDYKKIAQAEVVETILYFDKVLCYSELDVINNYEQGVGNLDNPIIQKYSFEVILQEDSTVMNLLVDLFEKIEQTKQTINRIITKASWLKSNLDIRAEIFDKDFGEYIDIFEDLDLVKVNKESQYKFTLTRKNDKDNKEMELKDHCFNFATIKVSFCMQKRMLADFLRKDITKDEIYPLAVISVKNKVSFDKFKNIIWQLYNHQLNDIDIENVQKEYIEALIEQSIIETQTLLEESKDDDIFSIIDNIYQLQNVDQLEHIFANLKHFKHLFISMIRSSQDIMKKDDIEEFLVKLKNLAKIFEASIMKECKILELLKNGFENNCFDEEVQKILDLLKDESFCNQSFYLQILIQKLKITSSAKEDQINKLITCLDDIATNTSLKLLDKFKKVISYYRTPYQLFIDKETLKIMGNAVTMSTIKESVEHILRNNLNIREVRFMVHHLKIDVSLNKEIWHAKNVSILAQKVDVLKEVTWDLSGQDNVGHDQ